MAIHVGAGSRGHERLPKFDAFFIQSVLSAADVVRLVEQDVVLKKQGDNLVGLCPFHSEKSPSFSVSPSKQFFHCFGCGKHGNAIDWLMDRAAMSFPEAVRDLAQSAGIALPDVPGGSKQPAGPNLAPITAANELAARFYQHCLVHDAGGMEYLTATRKLPREALNDFVIGLAPADWQGLKEPFPDYADNPDLLAAGLVIDKEGRRYDRFRNRLMFGIRDPRGRIIGFGGRAMDDATPKYLNSPQSAAFDKGSVLFGLHEAKEQIRSSKQAIVVEGYMDAVALHARGVRNAVASMGTACTHHQLARLAALAPDEIVFAFDGDAAGRLAARRALQNCTPLAADHNFRFFLLPDGKDPDELVIEQGPEGFKALVEKSLSYSGFLLSQAAQDNNGLATPEDRARFVTQCMETIAALPRGAQLYRQLRSEIQAASSIPANDVMALARAPGRPRGSADRWHSMAQAVTNQPASAQRAAEAILAPLPKASQDGFFAQQFESFAPAQRPFWEALHAAVCAGDLAKDTDSELAEAERDMLAACGPIIATEVERGEMRSLRAAVRSGQAAGGELLAAALRRHQQSG